MGYKPLESVEHVEDGQDNNALLVLKVLGV
jgi:hypothetical protein